MNEFDFEGRVALVRGGASGIGAASTARLRESGAQAAVLDLEPGDGAGDALRIGGGVSRSANLEDALARVERELGRLDYGHIANVASITGKEGNPMAAAYPASKPRSSR